MSNLVLILFTNESYFLYDFQINQQVIHLNQNFYHGINHEFNQILLRHLYFIINIPSKSS